MNCVLHPDVPAVAYCRTCGKALCATCKRDVRGVVYCEDCLASRVSDTVPVGVTAAPRDVVNLGDGTPVLAGFLGMIPGVGAMFNGQFFKAMVHVVVFAALIWGADNGGSAEVFFAFGICFWWFYMVFDAFKTARAKQLGQPLPDPFGFERIWSGSVTAGAANPTVQQPVPGAAGQPVVPQPEFANVPIGAIVLIGVGVLFLLDTTGFMPLHWMRRMWPVILIVLGVWVWIRRSAPRE